MSSCIPVPSSRALLLITISILCLLGVATGRSTQNFTIEVPKGTTNHGDPESLCTPTTGVDIASFLLFNYVAHGATVVLYPGESGFDLLFVAIVSILFPTYGVIRAFNFIMRHPLLTAKNDLEVATRSGALCMLVRSPSWKPQQGDNIRNALIKDPSTNISPSTAALSIYTPPWLNDMTHFWSYIDTTYDEVKYRDLFGLEKLPDQYEFVFVPRNAEVLGLFDSTPSSSVPDILPHPSPNLTESSVPTPKLSSSSNLAKGMVALLQLLYTSFTVYHTNGDQVNRYGFAAPGLTVIPYAVMSGLNLLASLVAPHYPKLYLVRSSVMEEVERRTGLRFHYVVGRIVDNSGTDSDNTVMEGWSEIAGSFKDDDEVLHVAHSAEEDKKIKIRSSSSPRIYVPACPRFRRTDDAQTSPLGQFNETPQHELDFLRYMARHQQALNRPSFFSFSRLSAQLQSCVQTLRPHIPLLQGPNYASLARSEFNAYENYLVVFISGAEFFIMLALSKFSGQQSTLAQRAWIVAWIFSGSLFTTMIRLTSSISRANSKRDGLLALLVNIALSLYAFSYGVPPIGGFVVVSQMLKAYGICYKFV